MGSSGTGTFGDYRGKGGDECGAPLDIDLEEVALAEFYTQHRALPAVGTDVRLRNQLFHGRLVVEVAQSGEILGLVPTELNYLLACLGRGFRYEGTLVAASTKPIPSAAIQLDALAS